MLDTLEQEIDRCMNMYMPARISVLFSKAQHKFLDKLTVTSPRYEAIQASKSRPEVFLRVATVPMKNRFKWTSIPSLVKSTENSGILKHKYSALQMSLILATCLHF